MIYLDRFNLLNYSQEIKIIWEKKNIYNTDYPLGIFPNREFQNINFSPITIFYGGNGSGKTTLLNIIGRKLNSSRKNINSIGELFDTYVNNTSYELSNMGDCKEIKFITSDDVFDFLLDVRAINSGVNRRKEELSREYLNTKYNKKDASIFDYEQLKRNVDVNHMTYSKYIRSRLTNNNLVEHSNGESALEFWEREITDHGIYLLDEPENSLSAENQLKLKQFIEDSARFYNCQFIISTHSPFILSLTDALIYDLDSNPVVSKKWAELTNVRIYYDFFMEHNNEFK